MNGRDESCRESSPSCFFVAQKLFWSPNFPKIPRSATSKRPQGKNPREKTPVKTGKTPKMRWFFLTKKLEPKQWLLDVFFWVFRCFSSGQKKLLGMTNFFSRNPGSNGSKIGTFKRWNHPSYTIIDGISPSASSKLAKRLATPNIGGHPSPISVEKQYHPRCGNTQQKSLRNLRQLDNFFPETDGQCAPATAMKNHPFFRLKLPEVGWKSKPQKTFWPLHKGQDCSWPDFNHFALGELWKLRMGSFQCRYSDGDILYIYIYIYIINGYPFREEGTKNTFKMGKPQPLNLTWKCTSNINHSYILCPKTHWFTVDSMNSQ